MRPPRVISIISSLLLAGCAFAEQHLPGPEASKPSSAAAQAPIDKPVAKPIEKPSGAAPFSPSRPDRPLPMIEPNKIVGLTQNEIRNLLGNPSSTSEEPPAMIWNYASSGCVFELFFYLDLSSQNFKALTYELKPKAPRGLVGSACLASFRKVEK